MLLKKCMKPIIGVIISFTIFCASSGAEKKEQRQKEKISYKALSQKEKESDRGLSFFASFDNNDVNADYAKGEKISTTMPNVSLALRGKSGFDGKYAFARSPGEELRFKIINNAHPEKGTVSIWMKGENYRPGDKLTKGKNRKNIGYLSLHFANKDTWVKFWVYEYGGVVYCDWRNSIPPQGWGSVGRTSGTLENIDMNEWFQLAFTWNKRDMNLYLNGEEVSSVKLPEKANKTWNIKADSKLSYIGIKNKIYNDDSEWNTIVDDVKIYDYALSSLEIKKQHAKTIASKHKIALDDFDIELDGVDDNCGGPDRLAVFMGFSALPDKYLDLLRKGKVKIVWNLSGPEDMKNSGAWQTSKLNDKKIISGLEKKGEYKVDVKLVFDDGQKFKASKSIVRPDLSFFSSKMGEDGKVPSPWIPLEMDGDSIKIWNRIYTFDNAPFPKQILIAGKPLLAKAPMLEIKTPGGSVNIKYKITGKNLCPNGTSVILTGSGSGKGIELEFKTLVEYDGFIKSDFTFKGSPEIESMKLAWEVNPEYRQFLLTPALVESEGIFEAKFPSKGLGQFKANELWLASEKGGFAWTAEHDANWVISQGKKNMRANRQSGYCEVTMIDKKVKLPENTSYHALFVASPTRPLIKKQRGLRHDQKINIIGWSGAMLTSTGTFDPDPVNFSKEMKIRRTGSAAIYGMAKALTNFSPVACYFKKYWDIPGNYSYNVTFKKSTPNGAKKMRGVSLSTCPNTAFNNFFPYNISKLVKEKHSDRVSEIYYDLGGNGRCGNELHGCRFKDKFGRTIKKYSILGMRRLVKRTVNLCHKNGKTFMLHAQRNFYPFYSGMADYWYPGEQYGSVLKRNPWAYTDEVSDEVYMSEHNSKVLGTAVMLLPSLGYGNRKYFKHPEYTEALFTMLLAHNIETSRAWTVSSITFRVWDIFDKYKAFESRPHLYYKQNTIKSSNPNVRITWHECPDGKYLLALCNKEPRPQTAEIDVSKLAPGDFAAREEYIGSDIAVKNGKFKIKIPARRFRLVGFPPAQTQTLFKDAMKNTWKIWVTPKALADFKIDESVGNSAPGSLMIGIDPKSPLKGKGSLCFLNEFPCKAESKYKASVYYRTENLAPKAVISLSAQLMENYKFAKSLKAVKKENPNSAGWHKLEMEFATPKEKENSCDMKIRALIGVKNSDKGKIWFDDFELKIMD